MVEQELKSKDYCASDSGSIPAGAEFRLEFSSGLWLNWVLFPEKLWLNWVLFPARNFSPIPDPGAWSCHFGVSQVNYSESDKIAWSTVGLKNTH